MLAFQKYPTGKHGINDTVLKTHKDTAPWCVLGNGVNWVLDRTENIVDNNAGTLSLNVDRQ